MTHLWDFLTSCQPPQILQDCANLCQLEMFILSLLCLWTQAKCDAQQDKKSDWMKTITHPLSFLHSHWPIAAQLGCASLLWLCKNRVPFFINALSTWFTKACAGFSFTVCFLFVFAVNFLVFNFISNVLVIKCQFRIEYPLTRVLHLISWCVTVCMSGWASSMKHKQGEFLWSKWIKIYDLHKHDFTVYSNAFSLLFINEGLCLYRRTKKNCILITAVSCLMGETFDLSL